MSEPVSLGQRFTGDDCHGEVVELFDADGESHDEIEPEFVRALIVRRPEGDFVVVATPEGLVSRRPH